MTQGNKNVPATTTPDPAAHISALVGSKTVQAQITRALDGAMDPARFTTAFLTEIRASELLRKCDIQSLQLCFVRAAQLGLDVDKTLGQIALVPRWNKDLRGYECTLQIQYGGMITLASDAGLTDDIFTALVYPEDEFSEQLGTSPQIVHRPAMSRTSDEDGWIRAYTVAFLSNGRTKFFSMSRDAIERHRDRFAPTDRSGKIIGPWVTDLASMGQKTCIRLMWKTLPKPSGAASARADRMRRAIQYDGSSGSDFDEGVEGTIMDTVARVKQAGANDPLAEAVALHGDGEGQPLPPASQEERETGPVTDDSPAEPMCSRAQAQRLAFLAVKVMGCSKDSVPQHLAQAAWTWNGGPVGYAIEKLSDIPAYHAIQMLEELEALWAGMRETAAAEGGAQ
ncbi:MAG: recombinase RecT [Planctomycetota bacterium]